MAKQMAGFTVQVAQNFGTCADCYETIHVGDHYVEMYLIDWLKKGFYVWLHRSCAWSLGTDLAKI